MALCCIGGVCIPYTAIIPLLIYGIQWLLQKLADTGLLPESICKQLQGLITIKNNPNKKDGTSNTCCIGGMDKSLTTSNIRRGKQNKETVTDSQTTTQSCCNELNDNRSRNVQTIESQEEWEQLVTKSSSSNGGKTIIVCKFTAAWCKPCKEIQPLFESLSNNNNNNNNIFVTVDADVLDDVAAMYNVLSLPTFVAIQNGRVLDKYCGSNPEQLQKFITVATSSSSSAVVVTTEQ